MFAYTNFPSWLTPEIIPGLPLRWYGLMYILAFGLTYLLFRVQVKEQRLSITVDDSVSLFLWTIIGLILGARIFATLVYDPSGYYLLRPWLIFWPFRNGQYTGLQGMSYHGGVIGAVAGGYLYSRTRRFNFLQIADLVTAGIPLGYTFGRLGNFINGELWGRVTTRPWGIVFPAAPRFSTRLDWVQEMGSAIGVSLEGASVNLPRHPSQLYEAAFEGVILWLFLWFVIRRMRRFPGFLLSWYLIGYGAARFVIEYFREPDPEIGFVIALGLEQEPAALLLSPWNFSMGQLLSFLMVIGGIVLIFLARRLAAREAERQKKGKSRSGSRPGTGSAAAPARPSRPGTGGKGSPRGSRKKRHR